MEEFLTRTAREVYEFLFDKGLPLELCDKIEGSYVILICMISLLSLIERLSSQRRNNYFTPLNV